jgi:glycosyltransferase involved in cell wall biosynthesis
MRILLVTAQDEALGGVASVVGNLARFLEREGHDVVFLYPGKALFPKQKINKLGFSGFELRMQRPLGDRNPAVSLFVFLFLFPIGIYQLISLLRRQQIQLINIHYPTDCFYYLAICSRMLCTGLVTSVHGAEIFTGGVPRSRYSRALKFLLSSSDLIVAPSRRFQQDFLSLFPNLSGKTSFIHNGVNLNELRVCSASSAPESPHRYVLCVSAYKKQKAIDVLIRAFERVHQTHPRLELVVVGAWVNRLRTKLENLATALGVQPWIQFLGPQGRGEVAKLLNGCEIFVLPSRFETFGLVILEAMACKKPVIATAVGGIPEIIENGKNGVLVEPDDPGALAEALVRVLNDSPLRRAIARAGYETVCQNFQSDHMGAAYQTAFGKILTMKTKIRTPNRVSSASRKGH